MSEALWVIAGLLAWRWLARPLLGLVAVEAYYAGHKGWWLRVLDALTLGEDTQ